MIVESMKNASGVDIGHGSREHRLLLLHFYAGNMFQNIFDGDCSALNRAVSCHSGSSSCPGAQGGGRLEEAAIRAWDRNQHKLSQVMGRLRSIFCGSIKREWDS